MATTGVSVLVVVSLSVIYAVVPPPDVTISAWETVLVGAVGLFAYVTLTLWAVMRLQRSPRPVQEGAILITVLATLIVLGYSWLYLAVVAADASSFNQPLTKASAVYFTVTVLATVGFGDIVAVSDSARLIVTSQMLLGITLLTLGIRLIMQSARLAAQRRGTFGLAAHDPGPGERPTGAG